MLTTDTALSLFLSHILPIYMVRLIWLQSATYTRGLWKPGLAIEPVVSLGVPKANGMVAHVQASLSLTPASKSQSVEMAPSEAG